jgi:hypothetical protein
MAAVKPGASNELKPDLILLGERAFEAATLLMITTGQRELLIFDPDLSRGGYQSLRCYEALRDFLSKGRQNRLTIVLHDSAFFSGSCPRLQRLFQTYSHSISVYLTDESAHVAQDAFALVDGKHYLHRFHINQARFKYVLDDEVAIRPLQERFDQLLDSTSSEIFPTFTGL